MISNQSWQSHKFFMFPLKLLWRLKQKTSVHMNENLCFDTKMYRYVNRFQLILNYLFCHISPRHVNSPEWLVLGWKYLPKSLYTHFWWVGERWFPTLLFIHMVIVFEIFYKIIPICIFEKTLAVLIIIYLIFFHFFTLF